MVLLDFRPQKHKMRFFKSLKRTILQLDPLTDGSHTPRSAETTRPLPRPGLTRTLPRPGLTRTNCKIRRAFVGQMQCHLRCAKLGNRVFGASNGQD
jgi:hypothetical protein